ncbi:MAG: hypothetical protein KCHDKBKB_02987 [Elusimicrobia bacterium]|nr:hypothetical protein [Elusimicrobiota bacterium]
MKPAYIIIALVAIGLIAFFMLRKKTPKPPVQVFTNIPGTDGPVIPPESSTIESEIRDTGKKGADIADKAADVVEKGKDFFDSIFKSMEENNGKSMFGAAYNPDKGVPVFVNGVKVRNGNELFSVLRAQSAGNISDGVMNAINSFPAQKRFDATPKLPPNFTTDFQPGLKED